MVIMLKRVIACDIRWVAAQANKVHNSSLVEFDSDNSPMPSVWMIFVGGFK